MTEWADWSPPRIGIWSQADTETATRLLADPDEDAFGRWIFGSQKYIVWKYFGWATPPDLEPDTYYVFWQADWPWEESMRGILDWYEENGIEIEKHPEALTTGRPYVFFSSILPVSLTTLIRLRWIYPIR